MKYLWMVWLSLMCMLAFMGCNGDNENTSTVYNTLSRDARFTTLVQALNLTGLNVPLQGAGPFTLFAPTNNAFDALPPGVLDDLLQDIPALTDLLLYHLVAQQFTATQLVLLSSVTTIQGQTITIAVSPEGVIQLNGGIAALGGANIIQPNIFATNGVIQVIDRVLIPPVATAGKKQTQ